MPDERPPSPYLEAEALVQTGGHITGREMFLGLAVSLPIAGSAHTPHADGAVPPVTGTGEGAGVPGQVRAAPEGPGVEDALTALADLVRDDLAACNRVIVRNMQSQVELIPQLAAHLVAAGGKRLRPILTLACARLCGYPESAASLPGSAAAPVAGHGDQAGGQRHVALAACVEFIHTATLLHDDVVDESRLRRGLATANAVFGNKASVLVGDFLFSRSFQLMTEDGSLPVLKILSSAAATIAEGEVLQLVTQNDLSTRDERYLDVIQGKTAALFAAACQIGAVVAGRSAAEEQALSDFGLYLGTAFQLVDDALDYAADQAKLGKTVGDDFREGKITGPVLAAYAAGSEADRVFWRRTIEASEQTDDDLDHALALMEQTGAIETTLTRARGFAERAKAALEIFPEGAVRRKLMDVADYTVRRGR